MPLIGSVFLIYPPSFLSVNKSPAVNPSLTAETVKLLLNVIDVDVTEVTVLVEYAALVGLNVLKEKLEDNIAKRDNALIDNVLNIMAFLCFLFILFSYQHDYSLICILSLYTRSCKYYLAKAIKRLNCEPSFICWPAVVIVFINKYKSNCIKRISG